MTRLLERYRTLEVLGDRDAVTTRLCADPQSGAKVVVRTLSLGRARSHDEVALFEREGAVLANLAHPRLPRVLHMEREADGDGVLLHQVRTYVEGRSLFEEARAGRHLTEREALRTALSVARTLAFLHERSPALVHRDVKPQNLIRMAGPAEGASIDDDVAVIDLGAVKAGPATGQTVVGTYGYMPPEQYEGQASPRSDVYALGMTLIFLLTHQEPGEFGDEGARAGFRRHANVSEACARLIDQLIAFDPTARPRDGRAAADAIERVLRGEASPGVDTRSRSKAGALAAVAAVLVLLAGGGAAAYFALRPSGPVGVEAPPVPAVPPTPTPPTSPATPARTGPLGLGSLEPKLRCFQRLVPRLLDSEARYRSWVTDPAGPTGKERHTYGLYAGYDDAAGLCAGQGDAEELASTFMALVKRAAAYYDEEDYRDDAFAEGRKMHRPLLDGFARVRALAARFDSEIDAALTDFQPAADDPVMIEAAGAIRAAWALSRRAPRRAQDRVDVEAFAAAYAELEAAVERTRAASAAPRTFRGYLVDRLEHHRTYAKRLLRGYQTEARTSRTRVDWDPDEVVEETLDFLVDLIHLERGNWGTW